MVENRQTPDPVLIRGRTNLAEIALTFDDGPSSYTERILQILRSYNIHATFFCIGSQVRQGKETVQRQKEEGHLVANHTWSHTSLLTLADGRDIMYELSRCSETIASVTGIQPDFFRPPYGEYDTRVISYAKHYGMTTALWHINPHDWERPGAEAIWQHITNHVRNGSIILLHDGGGDRSQTAEALPRVIEDLLQRDFRFVTLDHFVK